MAMDSPLDRQKNIEQARVRQEQKAQHTANQLTTPDISREALLEQARKGGLDNGRRGKLMESGGLAEPLGIVTTQDKSPQAQSLRNLFKNPEVARSFLLDPENTAKLLINKFPECAATINAAKTHSFAPNGEVTLNRDSPLYKAIREEGANGPTAKSIKSLLTFNLHGRAHDVVRAIDSDIKLQELQELKKNGGLSARESQQIDKKIESAKHQLKSDGKELANNSVSRQADKDFGVLRSLTNVGEVHPKTSAVPSLPPSIPTEPKPTADVQKITHLTDEQIAKQHSDYVTLKSIVVGVNIRELPQFSKFSDDVWAKIVADPVQNTPKPAAPPVVDPKIEQQRLEKLHQQQLDEVLVKMKKFDTELENAKGLRKMAEAKTELQKSLKDVPPDLIKEASATLWKGRNIEEHYKDIVQPKIDAKKQALAAEGAIYKQEGIEAQKDLRTIEITEKATKFVHEGALIAGTGVATVVAGPAGGAAFRMGVGAVSHLGAAAVGTAIGNENVGGQLASDLKRDVIEGALAGIIPGVGVKIGGVVASKLAASGASSFASHFIVSESAALGAATVSNTYEIGRKVINGEPITSADLKHVAYNYGAALLAGAIGARVSASSSTLSTTPSGATLVSGTAQKVGTGAPALGMGGQAALTEGGNVSLAVQKVGTATPALGLGGQAALAETSNVSAAVQRVGVGAPALATGTQVAVAESSVAVSAAQQAGTVASRTVMSAKTAVAEGAANLGIAAGQQYLEYGKVDYDQALLNALGVATSAYVASRLATRTQETRPSVNEETALAAPQNPHAPSTGDSQRIMRSAMDMASAAEAVQSGGAGTVKIFGQNLTSAQADALKRFDPKNPMSSSVADKRVLGSLIEQGAKFYEANPAAMTAEPTMRPYEPELQQVGPGVTNQKQQIGFVDAPVISEPGALGPVSVAKSLTPQAGEELSAPFVSRVTEGTGLGSGDAYDPNFARAYDAGEVDLLGNRVGGTGTISSVSADAPDLSRENTPAAKTSSRR